MSDTYIDPGYAVANTADEIIQRRRAEARQAMLDQLSQQNVQSEISARDENTRSQAQVRQARAEDQLAQAGQRWESNFPMDADITPNQYEQARKYHLESNFKQPQAAMGPDFEGPMPEGQTPDAMPGKFLGSPKERDEQARRQRTLAFLDAPDTVKGMDPLVRGLMRTQVLNGDTNLTMPAGAFKQNTQEPEALLLPNNTFLDLTTGQITKTVKPGTKITRGFQPRSGGAGGAGSITYAQATGPDGKPQFDKDGKPIWYAFNSKDPHVGYAQFPQGATAQPGGRLGSVQKSPDSRVSDTTYTEYINAKMAADSDQTKAGVRDQLAQRIIQEFKADEEVKDLARVALGSPKIAGMDAAAILQAASGGSATPQDVADFKALWGILAGKLPTLGK